MTASTEAGGADGINGADEADLVDLASAAPAECMALSTSAHWNQTEHDWRTMLSLGHGWGLRQRAAQGLGALVASTLVLPYGGAKFAWISMVLVLPAFRGRGHARRLLEVALADLASRALLPMLDATPAGRPVYLKQGFGDAWGFERWRRRAGTPTPAAAAAASPASPLQVRSVRDADWPALDAFDAPAFGASRLPLLRALAHRLPGAAWMVEDRHGPRGMLLGRDGRTALQLGPLVADDDEVALALLSAAFARLEGQGDLRGRDVIVDLCSGRDRLAAWLRASGFEAERPFTRMVHGAGNKAPGDARRIFLVAGPELG